MATYSTDLTTRTTADTGTFVELTGTIGGFTLSGGGGPGNDTENFIQGASCSSQTTGKATDAEISNCYDHGANLTFTAGHVVLGWCYYAVGANLKTKANDGWMFVICDSLTTGDYFTFGGSDSGRNPYGGWTNVAIDPTATSTGTLGAGANSGNYRYFGHVCNTVGEITKGNPSAIDAIRTGRGEISVTGTGGSFTELASYNDYNAGGTPPGTSSTSVDSGRHRLGLFQDQGGTFLWKGLMSLGITATTVTFTDSNTTIIIDDCPFSYAAFNKIEVNHASSSVTLDNVTFISTGTVAPGDFEAVDNATIALTGCSFNTMGAFVFQSNSTLTDCVFNTCSSVTTGGATVTGCSFNGLSAASAVVTATPAQATSIQNSVFVSDGTGNGLEIGGTATNITLTGLDFSGYSTSVDADKAIFVNIATGSIELNISGGSGVTLASHVRTAGATVSVVSGAVLVKATAITDLGVAVQNALVILKASNGTGPLPFEDVVTITRVTTTATVAHTAHGMSTNDKIIVKGITDKVEDNGGVKTITVLDANSYTYPTTDSGSASYTGTIIVTFVALSGLTDINGEISTSRVYSLAQPVTGSARKSSASPFLQAGILNGSVSTSLGFDGSAVMVSDE